MSQAVEAAMPELWSFLLSARTRTLLFPFLRTMRLLLLLFLSAYSSAFVPHPCVRNVTLRTPSVCCPIPPGRREPCGGAGWGVCKKIKVTADHFRAPPLSRADDRLDWPSRLFSHSCRCSPSRSGFACHLCAPGWAGTTCNRRLVRLRRNVLFYSDAEKHDLQRVLLLGRRVASDAAVLEERFNNRSDPLRRPVFRNVSMHEALVFIHRYASRSTLLTNARLCLKLANQDMNHKGPAFLTWHRYFILQWEEQLRNAALRVLGHRFENFTLPYWDWTGAQRCQVCSQQLVGNLSKELPLRDRGPFGKWLEICPKRPTMRGLCASCHWNGTNERTITRDWLSTRRSVFPTRREIAFALTRPVFFVKRELNVVKLVRRWSRRNGRPCQSFFWALEGFCGSRYRPRGVMHNRVHNMALGPLSYGASSPNDPFFALHHTQVDRIFERWLRKRRQGSWDLPPVSIVPPGHCRSCNMVGFYPPTQHKDVYRHSRSLGYDYDSFHFGHRF